MDKKTHTVAVFLFLFSCSWIFICPVIADKVSINTDWSWKAYSAISLNSTDWTEVNYDDTFWWDVDAPHRHKVAPTEIQNMENTKAQWIWSASSGGDDVFVYFRKTFYLTNKPTSALLRITADDDYWLYVNGVFVGSDSFYFGNASEGHWKIAERYDVTQLLNEGKNVIAVRVYDWGLYEGLLLDCTMEGTKLSPINFWISFPRWLGFLVFGLVLLIIVLAIIYIPKRVSDRTLIAFINSWEQVSLDVLAYEFGMDKKETRCSVY